MIYLFDIDGTLIRSFLREGGSKDEFDLVEPLPGRQEKVAELASGRENRFALVTNQGGVAFGYQTPEQVWRKIGVITATFQGFAGRPVSFHVCFTHPKATLEQYRQDSDRRKPGPGMLLEATRAHTGCEHWSDTLFVGDMETDEQAAEAARMEYADADEFFGDC